MAVMTLSRPAPATRAARPGRSARRAGWGLLTPFLVLYLLFLVGPLLYGAVMSFFNSNTMHKGLQGSATVHNYVEALSSSDFWWSVWHTVLFTIETTPPLVVLALVLALLVERLRRGRWFFRLVFFLPYVVPSASVALVFTWLYAAQIGLFSGWLSDLGIAPPNWLGDQNWAMASVTLMTIWWTLGFNFVLYLAGLQEIPRSIYAAATVDGATPWQQLRHITVPLLRRTTGLVTVLQVLASLKVFDQIYLLNAGGPNETTRPVLEYIYDVGFTDFRSSYAAAVSMLYFVLILLVSLGWLLVSRLVSKRGA